MADKLNELTASVLSFRSYVGKTGKIGYYVAVSYNGQAVTVFMKDAPNKLGFVPDPNNDGTFMPSDGVPVRAKFLFSLGSYAGRLNLSFSDCAKV